MTRHPIERSREKSIQTESHTSHPIHHNHTFTNILHPNYKQQRSQQPKRFYYTHTFHCSTLRARQSNNDDILERENLEQNNNNKAEANQHMKLPVALEFWVVFLLVGVSHGFARQWGRARTGGDATSYNSSH